MILYLGSAGRHRNPLATDETMIGTSQARDVFQQAPARRQFAPPHPLKSIRACYITA
jgi:hypothetical protein